MILKGTQGRPTAFNINQDSGEPPSEGIIHEWFAKYAAVK